MEMVIYKQLFRVIFFFTKQSRKYRVVAGENNYIKTIFILFSLVISDDVSYERLFFGFCFRLIFNDRNYPPKDRKITQENKSTNTGQILIRQNVEIQRTDERLCLSRIKRSSFVSERIENIGTDVAGLVDLVLGGKKVLF